MKGIVLAAGLNTRLYPVTVAVNKQLLPVYDKPMIYYPLSILLMAGIRDILVIADPYNVSAFQRLLGSGEQLGVKFSYAVQWVPRGIADAFIVGEWFVNGSRCALVLGDNVFFGPSLEKAVSEAVNFDDGAMVFGYPVEDPRSFGVVEFDPEGNVLSLEEKPKQPKSNYAVPGLYFYDNHVVEMTKMLKPSDRGELEITDLNKAYLSENKLKVKLLDDDLQWFDTGTHDSLLHASNEVARYQRDTGTYVGCLEEVAYRMGFISKEQLKVLGKRYKNTAYGQYLQKVADGG
ncbi:glucose-1-phosphate thymidylyltransferase RfbA [Coprothermobacter platensis]|uniref:glucose-1-phosphate thymidylyltransferase RfbA n=1 Tax=Coprothermobacter platensis TaxID=108819 RepID=UPI00037C4973|nr:glucose-1-phosphate thymidylyltransferase RfbA [Coprothermobacter platensis]